MQIFWTLAFHFLVFRMLRSLSSKLNDPLGKISFYQAAQKTKRWNRSENFSRLWKRGKSWWVKRGVVIGGCGRVGVKLRASSADEGKLRFRAVG